jgi:hypothetical protein
MRRPLSRDILALETRMTVTIQLPSEFEAELASQARAHGLDIAGYVEQVLRQQVATQRSTAPMSPAERAEGWRQSTQGLPRTPPLSDDAISRERIYGDRM